MELKDKIEQGIKQAISTRGKNKGKLKKKCPPMNTYGAAVWQAIMGHSNPYKVGWFHVIAMDDDKRQVYEHVNHIGNYIDLTTFDTDANILRKLQIF